MNLSDKLKSNILRDVDKRLQRELSMELYFFIANVKLDEGHSFHDEVEVIFNRGDAKGIEATKTSLLRMTRVFILRQNSRSFQKHCNNHYTDSKCK